MRIDRITVHRLSLPLATPYKLAFGPVEAFDTMLVEVTGEDGRTGWGEATPLAGYTEEVPDVAWRFLTEEPGRLAGTTTEEAKAALGEHVHAHPFGVTAVVTAIEMLEGHPLLDHGDGAEVPLLAIVNAMEPAAIREEVEARLADGYRALKVKVGFDPDRDAPRVAGIQALLDGRASIRLDGNQGYDQDGAVRFLGSLHPGGIELVEQLCPAGDWDAAVAVARAGRGRGIPIMLDESIYGADDIERAAELRAATHIKLKLMKCGGLTACAELLERIRALGMEPVLGNGVAADIGCWMEACVARRHIRNAGEMNGFLKPRESALAEPLTRRGPNVALPKGWTPRPDPARLERLRVATAAFGR